MTNNISFIINSMSSIVTSIYNSKIFMPAISFVAGLVVKTFFDWWTRKRQINLELRRDIQLSMRKDLFISFPKLIKLSKIQVQQYPNFVHPSYFSLSEEQIEKVNKEIKERSQSIIELKELCTMDVNIFKNKGEFQRILDEIAAILDTELPEFYKYNVYQQQNNNEFMNKINSLRNEFFEILSKELKI